MRVYFDNADITGRTTNGPHSFAARLARQLSRMGVKIVGHEDYDIALVTIEKSPRLNPSKPYVQRLDGLWFSPYDFQSNRNAGILRTYDRAEAVVFQSQFDRKFAEAWFGVHMKPNVICNGIELQHVDRVADVIMDIRKGYQNVFVCSSSWHGQKRLPTTIELYKRIKEHRPSSCLIVMGGGDITMDRESVKHDIFYTGPQPQDVCLQVFAASDYMIHLAWLDHCPNVVLESLSQDTPVICTSSGGTAEILGAGGKNGIVIKDVDFDFKPNEYDFPPQLVLPEGIEWLTKPELSTAHLDIKLCAQKYVDVFESVLSNV